MAWNTALAIAGAMPMIGVSPAPAEVEVRAVQQVDVDLRHVLEPRHRIVGETRVEDRPVLEAGFLP